MGMSNVATQSATPLSIAIGGVVLDLVTRAGHGPTSPRVVFMIGVALYALASVALRQVIEPRRNRALPRVAPA